MRRSTYARVLPGEFFMSDEDEWFLALTHPANEAGRHGLVYRMAGRQIMVMGEEALVLLPNEEEQGKLFTIYTEAKFLLEKLGIAVKGVA